MLPKDIEDAENQGQRVSQPFKSKSYDYLNAG